MFNKADIYTSSGSAKLYNSWTPTVAKFDTSSFYNWEQDNLPIYDLDERTYELWEYNGFPTSSVPGLALTVSADTPAATLAANRNIYTTVSAAIASLPRVVRFPILIEVCNFGDLGKIELNDFQIVENGSIEIINRGYSTVYSQNVSNGETSNQKAANSINRNGRSICIRVSSIDTSSTLNYTGASATSAVNLGIPVFSSIGDTRFTTSLNGNALFYPIATGSTRLRSGPLAVGINNNLQSGGNANLFYITNYYESNTGPIVTGSIDTMSGSALDFSATNQYNSTYTVRAPGTTDVNVVGAIYSNKALNISVKNCSGKVYIRNFFVNGGNRNDTNYGGVDNGIEIFNSDVVLENCSVVAAKKNGFLFQNSRVILSRMAYAYRNYEQLSFTTRSSEQSCGFRAVNSEVTLSSLVGGASNTNRDYQTSGLNTFFCASRNKIGFLLENSILNGGIQRISSTNVINKSTLVCELSNDFGIKAVNSQIKLKGFIDVYENSEGINLENSVLLAQEITCDAHNGVGIRARNSTILTNNELLTLYDGIDTDSRASLDFSSNGQHLNLDNSIFTFKRGDGLPYIHGATKLLDNHGVEKLGSNIFNIPSVKLTNNSKAEFINSQHINTDTNIETNSPCYGKLISAENNSTISLYGTSGHCTMVVGPATATKQKYISAVNAKNGSTVNIYGPTVISQAGVDILAENHSTINIQPALDPETNQLDISGFGLNDGRNHTSVDLHSTRACLVVDNNSVLNMENLGYFGNLWTGTSGTDALNRQTDFEIVGNDIKDYVSSGSIRFFPNPFNTNIVTTSGTNTINYTVVDSPGFTLDTASKRYEFITTTPSIGGICVRALNNSTVNAHNVHFGEGSNTGPLDGLYYNAGDDCCYHLNIWNLADTSKLKASLLSVSGAYGADAPYHGPASFYTSSNVKGSAGTTAVPAFYSPSATPDTATLSILDSFGLGGSSVSSAWKTIAGVGVNDPFDRYTPASSYNSPLASAISNAAGLVVSGLTTTGLQYGTKSSTQYDNYGLFRLYFSVDPAARYLQHNASGYQWGEVSWNSTQAGFSGVSGIAYQVFSQGYNMSASLSSIDPFNVSAIHPKLMKLSSDTNGDGVPNTLHPSGFYYCIEFVPNDPTQVIIDESAANIFANSKNASLGSSGRPKKVTIYRSGNQTTGESNTGSTGITNTFISTNIFDLKRDN